MARFFRAPDLESLAAMKFSAGWLEIAAFFAVSLTLALIYALAFAIAVPSKLLYAAARPLQTWLDHLSNPGRAQ